MKHAFTLIELLVVVTIIVMLLALLAPALDRAVYQAELTRCGAGLRGISTSVTTYAFDFKRNYPYRHGVGLGGAMVHDGRRPYELKIHVPGDSAHGDDRTVIEGYVALKSFLCPLSEEVDLVNVDEDTNIEIPYALYYGWSFATGSGRLPGLKRLGDRFVWNPRLVDPAADDEVHEFSVLAADLDSLVSSRSLVQAAHPDADGLLAPFVFRNQEVVSGGLLPAGLKYTSSYWSGSSLRGLMDRNFVMADNSVQRINGLKIDDPRLVEIPERTTTSWYWDHTTWLPR
jgi:prepilin-type N-terminal cleavage/methylation domain-containing protein